MVPIYGNYNTNSIKNRYTFEEDNAVKMMFAFLVKRVLCEEKEFSYAKEFIEKQTRSHNLTKMSPFETNGGKSIHISHGTTESIVFITIHFQYSDLFFFNFLFPKDHFWTVPKMVSCKWDN